ncbi:LuxR C-terminal-related transcriptional regulator [Pseudarthrobacter sp. PS3-L1]|uniref:LuxR C-terminal-related transcriptional regulator n=1 Tax=Pseudarthrobacter sp. PS3-L1 TaxID=3046207 RepID=UPI0024B9F410|nr:LuxR C-terminal-related transcriptional regulator [Pseudarthrobacter sp. PS3-L1]MDJ0319127.1 LuxR C-terminal-related transcriptional regulator [Pseudarthrobacter sp. PS3-L1]
MEQIDLEVPDPRFTVYYPTVQTPADVIQRPKLLSRLAAAPASVLISAPAGFGKTTLLSQWLDADPGTTAWVTVDQSNSGELWAAVLGAIQRCPGVQSGSLHGLGLIHDNPSNAVHQLGRLLAADGLLVRVVLDGVDRFERRERERWLPAFLNHRDLPVQLLMTARTSRSVDLGAARLTGRILELLPNDLAFSLDEAKDLAAINAPGLGAGELTGLFQQTEGWPAGLVLALQAFQNAKDPAALLADVAGNSRKIADYFERVVLAGLPPAEQEVLRTASLCRELNPGQAAAITGLPDVGLILASLADDLGFLENSGERRTVFRVRPLLKNYILGDLARRFPGELQRRHSAAAAWHLQAGQPLSGLWHALNGADCELIAAILEKSGVALINSGGQAMVRQGLTELGSVVLDSPALCLVAAFGHLEIHQPLAAARFLAAASRVWPLEPSRDVDELRTLAEAEVSWFATQRQQDPEPPVGWPESLVFSADPSIRIKATMMQVKTELARGNFAEAELRAQRALAEANDVGNVHLVGKIILRQASAASMLGDLRKASDLLAVYEDHLPERARGSSPGGVLGALIRSSAALLHGEPAAAAVAADVGRTELGHMTASSGGVGELLSLAVDLVKATAQMDLGGRQQALEGMRQVRARIDTASPFGKPLCAWMAVTEHAAAMALGHTRRAREILEWSEIHLTGTGELALIRAQGPAALNRFDVARSRLAPLHAGAVVPVLAWTWLHVSVLECTMALRAGQRSKAIAILDEALERANELNVLRPLVLAPQEIMDLLIERAGVHGLQEPLSLRLLALRSGGTKQRQSLTQREQEVLALLPSHLSQEQIAAELHLSVNTIKTHLRLVYAKLGVSSRHDAVAAAYRNGHLP